MLCVYGTHRTHGVVAEMKTDHVPILCPCCDFGSGHRGMSCCAACDGTGSVFNVARRYSPNTKKGFDAAVKAQEALDEAS